MNEYESLLRYYTNELTYLRRTGRSFAQRYPKVASRLELAADSCADPDVERVIESFALLTARIQRRLDSEFPEITTALLGAMYPNLVDPVPPMTIAEFAVDAAQGKMTSGHEIPRNTPLFAQSAGGLICRFRTCYPVTLWPLEVTGASLESPTQFDFLDASAQVASVLRIQLRSCGVSLAELGLQQLRFCLRGDSTLTNALYELIFGHALRVALLHQPDSEDSARHPVYLPPDSVLPVGFTDDEDVIPYAPHALPAYRLLQEYFLFPEKFLFFDLQHLDLARTGNTLDILILLDQMPRDRLSIDRDTFRLGCTPILNLFRKTTEPLRLDHRQLEYRLEPDHRRQRMTEIHSIQAVSASSNPAEETMRLEPFFSFRHRVDGHPQRAFWYSRRVPTDREDLPGTDVLISFVDLDFNPKLPPDQTVYAHVMCTNRDFATQLPDGAVLQIEDVAPIARISCLGKPTHPAYPPLGGSTLWNLISNLSLNYLSLSGGPESLHALREILHLYSFSDQPSTHQQVQGMREMSCRRVTRRVGMDAWRGFCHGTEVTLTFDEKLYVGSSPFLMGAVLSRFLALYGAVNSFTQLVIKSQQREGEWKRWPPVAGTQQLM
jgi:type VI secretion system protein ImpG